jgi:Meckel syndrome type 1 protein
VTAAVVAPRSAPPDPRLLQRCLLLAVLLHVWLVLMFGNTRGSTAPGGSAWGSLTVKLTGRSGADGTAPPTPAGTGATPRPSQTADRTADVADTPPAGATLQLPEGFRPIERQHPGAPRAAAPVELPTPELPAAALGRLDHRSDALAPLRPDARLQLPSRTAELPAAPGAELPAPVQRLDAGEAPATPATLPRPAELRSAPAQAAAPLAAAPELPAAVSRLEGPAPAVAAATLPRAAELRALPTPPAVAAPDGALPSAVQRLDAPTADRSANAPLPRPGELRSAAAPAPAALPATTDLPAPVQRLEPGEGAARITPLQPGVRGAVPAPAPASLPELAGSLPGQVSAPSGPAAGEPAASPQPSAAPAAPRAGGGAPDGGTRLGPDLPQPPQAAASAARAPLNLSLPRGDMSARRGPGLVELLPPPPERKSKLEQSIEEATAKDCRKAYPGAGLLAVVPLAVDAARGKGCKW